MNRMFPGIDLRCNPVKGKCPYECVYCWVPDYAKRFPALKCYLESGCSYDEKALPRKDPHATMWIGVMRDIFSPDVPSAYLNRVFDWVETHPQTTVLTMTKNPQRYWEFWGRIGDLENIVLGATVESNRNYSYSLAPSQGERLHNLLRLRERSRFLPVAISVEPILKFDLEPFLFALEEIQPFKVYIGYDNYNHRLEEPTLEETRHLIQRMRSSQKWSFHVEEKTLRKAWYEESK